MKDILLDFDGEAKVKIKLYEHNHYEKVFHVTKGGVDYTWPNVTEMVLLVKPDVKSAVKTIELKLSAGDIVLTPGYMKLILPAAKTNVAPGTYKSVELMIVFSNTKPRIWWAGGECEVKTRGIEPNG